MSTVRIAALAAFFSLVLVGCSDGGVGEKGVVRFSQVVNFVETDDFSPPLVTARTVLIRLERAEGRVTRERGFPELSLEVTGGAAQVLPLGFAQFAVRLDDAASYRFLAKDGAATVDAITVTSKKGARLRPHAKATITTTGRSNGKTCTRSGAVDVEDLTLAPNQTATFFVVPVDEADKPMLGLLQLTARTGRKDLELDTPLFFEGGSPNTLMVRPTQVDTDRGELELSDPAFPKLVVPLRVSATEVPVSCE